MRYFITIERGGTNFSACAPDLPGCAAAADTEQETITLLQAALALHLEDMRERGEPIPEPLSFPREVEVAA